MVGPSGMCIEDLKGWSREATHKKESVRRMWEILVRLAHQTFGEWNPPEDLTWATMDLIPEGKGEFWCIGLIEVAWKVCAEVVNCRLKRSVVLHDALHGFRVGQGMGTATLEAKLDQQLSRLVQKPLFQVFLDICKVYASLVRVRQIKVLRGYGMRTNLARLLKSYWDCQSIVPKTGEFLGKEFRIGRRLTQGDPVSPIIFNIVVDAVVRAVLDVVCGLQEAQHSLGWAAGDRNLIFMPTMAG